MALGQTQLIVPSLLLSEADKFDRLHQLVEENASAPSSETYSQMQAALVDVLFLSLKRNYPSITSEYIKANLTTDQFLSAVLILQRMNMPEVGRDIASETKSKVRSSGK
ncbi:hypothetical protein [Parvibium lacunae]|uniref:hypothetical protein n=1 Tax=Parvibium lacunae TaxID=1888893 RepID=UPI0011C01A90|nr:hypothetical protein [Parvibium lacunae]